MSFVFLSNRATTLVNAVWSDLGGRLHTEADSDIDLLYFDTYGGRQPPAKVRPGRTLMPRQHTAPLDQKHMLARRLRDAGIDTPRHCFDPAELPDEPETCWYVKDAMGTGGRDLWLCRPEEVATHFRPGYVIQEALRDVVLFNDKKFTLRLYVLVHSGCVYWYPEGFLVVHAQRYDPADTSADAHYSHSGYMRPLGRVQLLATRFHLGFAPLVPAIRALLGRVFALFREELGAARNGDKYCLFGVDLLQLPGDQVALIEINDRPCFTHTPRINRDVNGPMLQALAQCLIPERTSRSPAAGALLFEPL